MVDWTEIYRSLQIESLKASGRVMFIITFTAGLVITAVFFLAFRKNLFAVAIIAAGAILFSGRYAVGVWMLSRNPRVYTGVVIAKTENSHTDESTATRYVTHKVRINTSTGCDLTEKGLCEFKDFNPRKLNAKCSESTFNSLTEGDKITVIIMPHNKSIVWFRKTEYKLY